MKDSLQPGLLSIIYHTSSPVAMPPREHGRWFNNRFNIKVTEQSDVDPLKCTNRMTSKAKTLTFILYASLAPPVDHFWLANGFPLSNHTTFV